MDMTENWEEVKDLFRESFISSFHYAIATVNGEGEPHVTPIGSLILGKPGHGLYLKNSRENFQLIIKLTNKFVF